jgi:KaiC/GvpD/RAD55 family RecA-like ATPase
MLSRTYAWIVLVLLLAILIGSASIRAEEQVTSLVLYAITDPSATQLDEKVLRVSPPSGPQSYADAKQEITFYLDPVLDSSMRVTGSVAFRLWLRSNAITSGYLSAALLEVSPNGSRIEVMSMGATILLSTLSQSYEYASTVDHLFPKGSRIAMVTRLKADSPANVLLLWNDPSTPTQLVLPVVGGAYHLLQVKVSDASGEPLQGANVTVSQSGLPIWSGLTDRSGLAIAQLRSSDVAGPYDITARWRGVEVAQLRDMKLRDDSQVELSAKVHNFKLSVKDHFGGALRDANVHLMRGSTMIAEGRTDRNGTVVFAQLPEGAYSVEVDNWILPGTLSFVLTESTERALTVIVILHPWHLYGAGSIVLVAVLLAGVRRFSRRERKLPFGYFRKVTGGEIPRPGTVMIYGSPGSGKSVLVQHLAYEALKDGCDALYIANSNFPAEVMRDMGRLGLSVKELSEEAGRRFTFIDCYSGIAGKASGEEYAVPSPTDLTGLGVMTTSLLSKSGGKADVFFDSLTPLFTALRPDSVISFVRSIGAKVKGFGGRFFFTVGTGVDEFTLTRLEGEADCVIQTELTEKGRKARWRLRIKKMRGEHSDRWVEFTIESKKGILFFARKS